MLILLTWSAGRAGFASLLIAYAGKANVIEAADAAVNLSPRDPEAHLIRGAILEAKYDLTKAVNEYSAAVSLRPEDYVLWLSLARARELAGDIPNAIAAGRQAVLLAPHYAEPHWQLGNLLVRAGQRAEGFAELRLGATSDPTLLPSVIDLAWQLSRGDAQLVSETIGPQTPEARSALADYFRKQGKVTEAIAMYATAGAYAEPNRRQYLSELIFARRFNDAYTLWLVSHPGNSGSAIGTVVNPGFEQEINLDEPGFGWRTTNRAPLLTLSLDDTNPREGRSSLSVEFKGEADPGAQIISQLVLVTPNTHYQLHFAARTENIVSGGLPRLTVLDGGDNQALGPPASLPQPTGDWQDYTIDFTSNTTTTAILISCQRDSCSKTPCPIFGRVWLDNFSLIASHP